MVRIRLKRVGKTKQPHYRVVVADSRSPRDGRIIESIGHYHPLREPSEVVIDLDRANYWIERGAQPSEQVAKLLKIADAEGGVATPAAAPAKTTTARPKKITAAASVADETEGAEDEAAELPEAVDQGSAAPEADVVDEDQVGEAQS